MTAAVATGLPWGTADPRPGEGTAEATVPIRANAGRGGVRIDNRGVAVNLTNMFRVIGRHKLLVVIGIAVALVDELFGALDL